MEIRQKKMIPEISPRLFQGFFLPVTNSDLKKYLMAQHVQHTPKSRPFELQNGHSDSTTNVERYLVLIKSFLSTVGSDVLRSLLMESAENAEFSIEEFLYQHQTSIIYVLQNRMRSKLQLVYPPDDTELDLHQWNCHLLCLVLRATNCLGETLLDDVSFIERTDIRHSKDEVTLMRRTASSFGKQLQPKKEWARICAAVQRLAEHLRDTRLLTSVRNFIYKVEMGTKLMDARIETHLSLTKMISELAASHSGRMNTKDNVYTAPLGELTKIKQQYDMVSKPSFSESRSPQTLSRTMIIDGEPTRPLSSRDNDVSDKPVKSTSVIHLSTRTTPYDDGQIKRSNSSELITIHTKSIRPPPKRDRPFSNTSLGSIPSRSVKLVTPRMSLSQQSRNKTKENAEDFNYIVQQALENMVHCHDNDTENDNEIATTNSLQTISVKRQIKSAPTKRRGSNEMLNSTGTNETRQNYNSRATRPHSYDNTRSVSRINSELPKTGDEHSQGNNNLLRNTMPLHSPILTKDRANDVVKIYTKSVKLHPKEKSLNDKADRKQTTVTKTDMRTTVAERQEIAMKIFQQPTFSSLVAYTMKYQRSIPKKKTAPANATTLEKVHKTEEQDKDDLPPNIDENETNIANEKDLPEEPDKTLLDIENKDVTDKLQTRRKSTFGRLKDIFKNALLPNKHGSESISSQNSSGTLLNAHTPTDSFSTKDPSMSGTPEKLSSHTLPTKTTVSALQSDGCNDIEMDTEPAKDDKIESKMANEPDKIKQILEENMNCSTKPEAEENKEGSVKELAKKTRVKFALEFKSSPGKETIDYNRKRRQSLPLLTFRKSDEYSSAEKTHTENISQSTVISRKRSSITPPTQRRASITASTMQELSKLQKSKIEFDRLKHFETKQNSLQKSREEKDGMIHEDEEKKASVKFRGDIVHVENNSKPESEEETYAPKISAAQNTLQKEKQVRTAKHRRKSIAISRLTSSMRVGNNINQPIIERSNSESELNITITKKEINEQRATLNGLSHSFDKSKKQEKAAKNRKEFEIIKGLNMTAQSSEGTEFEQIDTSTDSKVKLTEIKPKQQVTQKSLMASSLREQQLKNKKEFVRAKSESEFNLSTLKVVNHSNDSEFLTNLNEKKTAGEIENSKQNRKSLLDGAVLYEYDEELNTNSSKQQINEIQSVSHEPQESIIQTQILQDRVESNKEETQRTDVVSSPKLGTNENDANKHKNEPAEDPEAEMKRIANDVIVHHQVHKAAREFMEKDKDFVDKFFVFLHKYQATKEFLRTEQYSPFKTMKLPTGIKASLSFIHAFTFRHVNVFDRDQCNHVVEKILKRTDCEDAKRCKKKEKEILKRITDEMEQQKLAKSQGDRRTNSRKSKNKDKANKGKDESKHQKDKEENKHFDSLLKDLQELERCQCWKCRQKDLAMTIAVNWRNHVICELLLKYGVPFRIEHLLPAVRANDGENVKEIVAFLKRRYEWDTGHEEARMALILARFHNMQDIVTYLEKEGVQDERVVQCACFA